MKIGVIADSHDNLPVIRRAVEFFNGRDDIALVIHAGDFVAPFAMKELLKLKAELRGVFGNNDGERKGLAKLLPGLCDPPVIWEIGGRNVAVAHSFDELAADEDADVMIYGHSHSANVVKGPPLMMNPGECGGWLTGKATVAVVDLKTLDAEIVELT